MALMDTGLTVDFNSKNNLTFPNMEKAQTLGCFSIDTNRGYKATAENFRYFRMPRKFPLDLNEGYGLAKCKAEPVEDERLNSIVQFIYHHKDQLISKPGPHNLRAVKDIDFICFRGLLRLVMCTPYENLEDWSIHATNYKGNVYLSQAETEQKRHDRLNENDRQKKICAYGHKFEQFCMRPNPTEAPVTNLPVDECEEFYCMYKSKLTGMNLLFGADIDGALSTSAYQNIEDPNVLNSIKLVELKCPLRPANEQQQQNFYRLKFKNWWCHSFLVGIQDLKVGYRNEGGLVDEIKHMEVRSLPRLGTDYWTPSICANFLVRFLQMVKYRMADIDCPYTVYEFYFNPRSRSIRYRIYEGKTAHTILPDWYVMMLQ